MNALLMPRAPHPYAGAARLPPGLSEGERVDVHELVKGRTIEIEIGPGRGGFLFERAAAAPEAGLVGFEVRLKWAAIVDARLAKAGLGARARVFAEDAKSALARLGPDGSVARFFVHFPDPWWKKRHEKRLVMGDVLVRNMARLLAPGGELFVQSDVEERVEQYETMLLHDPDFAPAGDAPGSARLAENPYDARSPREHRAIKDGLPVHRLRYRRR
jgi:tRNA (guanine-N7-)-methyltransferase